MEKVVEEFVEKLILLILKELIEVRIVEVKVVVVVREGFKFVLVVDEVEEEVFVVVLSFVEIFEEIE